MAKATASVAPPTAPPTVAVLSWNLPIEGTLAAALSAVSIHDHGQNDLAKLVSRVPASVKTVYVCGTYWTSLAPLSSLSKDVTTHFVMPKNEDAKVYSREHFTKCGSFPDYLPTKQYPWLWHLLLRTKTDEGLEHLAFYMAMEKRLDGRHLGEGVRRCMDGTWDPAKLALEGMDLVLYAQVSARAQLSTVALDVKIGAHRGRILPQGAKHIVINAIEAARDYEIGAVLWYDWVKQQTRISFTTVDPAVSLAFLEKEPFCAGGSAYRKGKTLSGYVLPLPGRPLSEWIQEHTRKHASSLVEE